MTFPARSQVALENASRSEAVLRRRGCLRDGKEGKCLATHSSAEAQLRGIVRSQVQLGNERKEEREFHTHKQQVWMGLSL